LPIIADENREIGSFRLENYGISMNMELKNPVQYLKQIQLKANYMHAFTIIVLRKKPPA
jgi:hypothetical protein